MNELKKIIVEELINSFGNGKTADTYFDTVAGNIVDKLPSLKDEQIITEDRIIEVLYNSVVPTIEVDKKGNIKSGKGQVVLDSSFKQIASEILKGQGWEVQGKITGDQFEFLSFRNGKGADFIKTRKYPKVISIAVAVREVK